MQYQKASKKDAAMKLRWMVRICGAVVVLWIASLVTLHSTTGSPLRLAASAPPHTASPIKDTYKVTRPVRETHKKIVAYAVMRPVYEQRSKTVTYTQMTVVREQKTKTLPETGEQLTYTVTKHVPEQREKLVHYTVCRMVPEQKKKLVEYQTVRFETAEISR